jgi:hypothetical protein
LKPRGARKSSTSALEVGWCSRGVYTHDGSVEVVQRIMAVATSPTCSGGRASRMGARTRRGYRDQRAQRGSTRTRRPRAGGQCASRSGPTARQEWGRGEHTAPPPSPAATARGDSAAAAPPATSRAWGGSQLSRASLQTVPTLLPRVRSFCHARPSRLLQACKLFRPCSRIARSARTACLVWNVARLLWIVARTVCTHWSHVQGGTACIDFQMGRCFRGAACRFTH